MPKTVFLDRDGIINQCAASHEYITEWKEFIFLPGVENAIRKLRDADYQVICITNQRCIARGIATKKQIELLHDKMQKHLEKYAAQLDGIYVCPHNDGECNCRKPNIGLFQQAERDFNIEKESSWMIGDSITDVEAGRRYGIKTVLTTSLQNAVQQILTGEKGAEGI